jgi:catechol 2,3-dioxygenase-like lactoylglutathione lyase family enzyme
MEIEALSRKPVRYQKTDAFPRIVGLNHVAYRCRDSEETRHFYEDILNMPLIGIVWHDHVPSTGEYCPYFHLFFEMADGGCIAFFDLFDGRGVTVPEDTPKWVNHLALTVESEQALHDAKEKLVANGVEVIGPTVHSSSMAIYFFDPNGIRLELAYMTASEAELVVRAEDAREILKKRSEIYEGIQERRAKGIYHE